MIQKFNEYLNESEYINESVTWEIEVEDPYSDRDEKKAANSIKIVADPITVVDVSGLISEDEIDAEIQFSNGDMISYDYRFRNNSSGNAWITINGKEIPVTKYLDKYMGSTGTVVGDLGLIYKDFKIGKIK
jgi:cytochrome b involved in lipid metabolism